MSLKNKISKLLPTRKFKYVKRTATSTYIKPPGGNTNPEYERMKRTLKRIKPSNGKGVGY